MIDSIEIDGYKCLKNLTCELGSLNVLAGPNASGKSSMLQTLLLLRQSADSSGHVKDLHLSGPLYEAGTAKDVLHPAAEHKVRFALKYDEQYVEYNFSYDRNDESRAPKRILQSDTIKQLPTGLGGRGGEFVYLNAERLGPRLTYPLPPEDPDVVGLVGKFGQFTPAILARASNGIAVEGWTAELARIFACAPHVLDGKDIEMDLIQTQGRLDEVCNRLFNWVIPGATFEVAEHDQGDYASLRYGRTVLEAKTSTRATHSGFGLTYTLPIMVGALALKQGGTMIVENPEAHLPPFSQSRIGVFLAMVASTGRQLFVETHSDHIINGIRLAVRHQLVPADAVFMYFFNRPIDTDTSVVAPIRPRPNGRLDKWPKGFFDQIEDDLSRL